MTEIESHRICTHLNAILPQYDKVRLDKHFTAAGITMREFMRHNINSTLQKEELEKSDSDLQFTLTDEYFISLVRMSLDSPPPQEKWDFYNAMIFSMENLATTMLEDPEHKEAIDKITAEFPDKDSLVAELRRRDKE